MCVFVCKHVCVCVCGVCSQGAGLQCSTAEALGRWLEAYPTSSPSVARKLTGEQKLSRRSISDSLEKTTYTYMYMYVRSCPPCTNTHQNIHQ